MKHIHLCVLACLLIVPLCVQGQGPQEVDFFANTPPPVNQAGATAQVVGTAGTRNLFYWIVAVYPIGRSFPMGPVPVTRAPDTMTGANFVRVSWAAMPYATSYDVLRTTTANFPSGTNSIALATGVTASLYVNNTDVLAPYTLAVAPSIQGYMRLNNRDYTTPRFELYPPLIQTLTVTNLTVTGTFVFPGGGGFIFGAEPVCNVVTRGIVAFVVGGVGVADTFRICTKDAANAYAYRALY